MICVVISKEDIASVKIGKQLLSLRKWKKRGKFYLNEDFLIYFINDLHIYHDNIDEEIEKFGYSPSTIIFASRHASKAEKKTLSVHAIGNFSKAEYGGIDKELIKCNPLLMRNALILLKEKNLDEYEVCYEATHHGPYLKKPCFFIEVGSTEKEWRDDVACKAIAEAILNIEEEKYEVAIGIGGGHYAPRFTDIALGRNIAFGHISAKYAVEHLNEKMIDKMLFATPGCKKAYFHGGYKKIENEYKNKYKKIEEMLRKRKISIS